MPTYTMTCTCGDTIPMDAPDRNAAVAKFKAMMTTDMVAGHMKEKHPGEPVPPVSQVHAMIETQVQPLT